MKLYLDVLLIENGIVNYFLLYLTSKSLKMKYKSLYLLFASILAALYVLTIFLPQKVFTALPFKIAVAFITVFIAFPKGKILFYLKSTLVYLFFSMALAGLCVFLAGNEGSIYRHQGYVLNFSYKNLMLSIMILFILGERLFTIIKNHIELKNLTYKISFNFCGKDFDINAFLDTGNELREPVTNLPVIVVEEDLIDNLKDFNGEFYSIPFKAVNGGNGKLKAIKPKEVIVDFGDHEESKTAIIAFCTGKLSRENSYNGLLSRGVI